MQASSYRLTGVLLALLGVVTFSFRPVLIKLAYGYVRDPITLIALRMAFSLPFFLAAALWSGRGHHGRMLSLRELAVVFGLGAIGYYLASTLDFLGLQYVTAGVGRLILFVYPTIVMLLSAVFFKKPIRKRDVAALGITYAGVALVLAEAVGGANLDLPLGVALGFGSALAYAIYLVIGAEVAQRIGAIRFAALAISAACLCCILQFLLLRPLSALALPSQVYGLMVIVAAVCTVIPVFLTAEALRRIGANQVAMIGAVGPISAIVFGGIVLGESMSRIQLAGAALVIIGVLLATVETRAAKARS
ncbi:MAG TPA: DMT family transporter [Candidatus Acidoferrum sp.]|nr:DMT family transporter [Candidatus Acidoferrum sp.]